ncbi:hypothetical protein Aspvir_005448 [Aspergillus viridinutans]|uniref:Uncharacterized protein n=1 Tax=Aspergillus viridinutans TaxID=75553 RepID=A0A9P3BXH2_ASPVI|nr:uncharacterized protein Aspvir_005448 [Aspergillus viridinutans]GIK01412.1 hypothetical protein Aspvir_005448 [Aspergillus viridinutans]
MPASPTRQQGRERKASDSDKPEAEHVEEAGVSGEETEGAPGEPEPEEPWELYRRGLKPSEKLLEDARASLRGTMLSQLKTDKAAKENRVLLAAMMSRIFPTAQAAQAAQVQQVQQVQQVPQVQPPQQYPINQLALGPHVSYGEHGAYPRWVVVPVPQQGNQQLPKAPGSHKLMWKFEPGPPSGWRGLTKEQLYEWSYNWHRACIEDPEGREAMISHLRVGPYKEFMKGVAQPLPPLPDPPATNFYLKPITPPPPGLHDFWRWSYKKDYTRPTAPIRQGMYSRGLNPGQQGVGDEENQLPGIGTYRNEYGANRLGAEAGPAKPLALDDGQEPAIDADPNGQTLESGLDLDAMDGASNGLPTISSPKLAVQDPGNLAAKKGIRAVARIKIGPRPGQAGPRRIVYETPKQAPGVPPDTGSEPETEPESEPEIQRSKEHELVTEALEQLKKNHEKHFPRRTLRRIRTWPGDEIPNYISNDELKLVPEYSLEHRPFHDRNPAEQGQTAKRAASGLPKQAAGAAADSDDNDGSATAGTAGRAKKSRTTKKSTTAGTAAPAQQSRYPKRTGRK